MRTITSRSPPGTRGVWTCAAAARRTKRLERIAAGAADTPGDGWLFAYNYTPRAFTRRRGLTRHDLDRVAGDRPVLVMHFSFHEAVVSSAGLRAAGIDRETPDPFGGRIVRDRHGEPTGELLETAVGRVEALARRSAADDGYDGWLAALERYCRGLVRGGDHVRLRPRHRRDARRLSASRAARRAVCRCRCDALCQQEGLFLPPTDRLDGPVTGETVDGLPVGALKLFADGGSRCAVCVGLAESLAGVVSLVGRAARARRPGLLRAASAPERPRWGDGSPAACRLPALPARCAGVALRGGERARLPTGDPRRLQRRDRSGNRRAGAVAAGAVSPSRRAPRLARPRPDAAAGGHRRDRRRAADLHRRSWATNGRRCPRRRACGACPLRDLLDAGITLAGSSDAPIAPYSPLAGMQAAITRRTAGGLIHQGDQAITPLEALRLWTTGGALAANLPGEIGVLRPGARADLVVLSANPLDTPPGAFDTHPRRAHHPRRRNRLRSELRVMTLLNRQDAKETRRDEEDAFPRLLRPWRLGGSSL